MTKLTKYWPALAIILAFLSGYFSKSDNSKELESKYNQERQKDKDAISELQRRSALKVEEFDHFKKQMRDDSLKTASALERNQRAYVALKKRYEEINLSRATSAQLDSLVSVLYGE